MKRILVPTNFSTQAGWAIEVAAYLSSEKKANLVLLHVVEYPANYSFDVGQEAHVDDEAQNALLQKVISQSELYLNELASNLSAIGISVSKVLRHGNLLHAIKMAVSDYNVDLVVMGTSRHSKIREMLDGSRTEQVVKLSEAPVLAVHRKPSNIQFRNIVYAIHANEKEHKLPGIVTSVQKLYGATLHIAAVNTANTAKEENSLKHHMEDFAKKYKLSNYSINVVNDDSAEVGIRRFAQSIAADLIVVDTRGRTGTNRDTGRVPQELVDHSNIPVLSYFG